MKICLKLLKVIAMCSLLTPNLSFGSENRNSVASVSSLEMWHLPMGNNVVKWTPKEQPDSLGVVGDTILFSEDLTNELIKLIKLGITDAQIINWAQSMASVSIGDSVSSAYDLIDKRLMRSGLNASDLEWIQFLAPQISKDSVCSIKDLVDLQQNCRCIDARVCLLLSDEAQTVSNSTIKALLALHRICRFIDTAINHLLGDKLVIFDTDIGSSTDDLFALQMLCRYMDAGKCRLLGVIIDRYGENNARVADLLLTYLGHPEIPVGIESERQDEVESFIKYSQSDHPLLKYCDSLGYSCSVDNYSALPEGWLLYRQLLTNAPDNSVEIISVGFMTQLSGLLTSRPDTISPLSGVELVEKKVKRIYIMGSKFTQDCFNGKPGYNLKNPDPKYAATVFELLPSSVEIMISPDDVGERIKYENDSVLINIKDCRNLIRVIYDLDSVDSGQFMWDPLPVIQCIEGDDFFCLSEKGHVHMKKDSNGESLLVFTPDSSGNVRFQYIPDWRDEDIKYFIEKVLRLIRQSY